MADAPARIYVTLAKAGEMVSLSSDTIGRAIASGQITPYRPGGAGRTLVRVDELLGWVESAARRAPGRGPKGVRR